MGSEMQSPDIEVRNIVTTGGTQSRAQLCEQAVADYAEALSDGQELPPIVVFHDGSAYWLADGFHRVMAATRANVEWLPADIRKGTKRDAILHSVGANATHGLPRTNADKRHAVTLLLQDEEWAAWSNCEIARRCAVHQSFVAKLRSLSTNESDGPKTYTTKHGTEATMRTENIGQRKGFAGAKAEKTEAIRELSEQGYRASQIAGQIGLTEDTVRLYANEAAIELPDKAIGPVRKLNNRRVIEQTVLGLEASAASLSALPVSFDDIAPAEAAEWADAVGEALRVFRKFHKQLTEAANG